MSARVLLQLFSSMFCCVLSADASIVSRWSADDITGTTVHDSVGTNDGELVNGATTAPGVIGNAFSFDGTDDYMQIFDDASLKPAHLTVQFWFNSASTLNSSTDHVPLLAKLNSGDNFANTVRGYDFFYEDGRIRFGLANDRDPVNDHPVDVAAGTWHHVAGTFDGAEQKLYFDGLLVSTEANTVPIDYGSTASTILVGGAYIHSVFGPDQIFFQGRVDEIELYNHARSATEIAAAAIMPVPVPASFLIWTVLGGISLWVRQRRFSKYSLESAK
jgi:hypothetical protein